MTEHGYVCKTIGIKPRYDSFKTATRDQTLDTTLPTPRPSAAPPTSASNACRWRLRVTRPGQGFPIMKFPYIVCIFTKHKRTVRLHKSNRILDLGHREHSYFNIAGKIMNRSLLVSFRTLAVAASMAAGAVFAQQAAPVKIGVLTDMQSGFSSWSGKGSVIAARMAVEDFQRTAGRLPS